MPSRRGFLAPNPFFWKWNQGTSITRAFQVPVHDKNLTMFSKHTCIHLIFLEHENLLQEKGCN